MKIAQENSVAYQVVRSRRSTADIVLERDGSLVVRAPEWIDDTAIQRIVHSKKYWIHKTLAEWRDLNASQVPREYKSGEGFLYLGRSYRLKIVTGQQADLILKDGRFLLSGDLLKSGGAGAARQAFQAFFEAKGLVRIGSRVDYFAPKVGVKPQSIIVGELGHRWASCSPLGVLSFHWKCMMAPLAVIDYVIVHELCHFHHLDHSESFWNEVDKIMPDFRARKEWLRRHGAALDCP